VRKMMGYKKKLALIAELLSYNLLNFYFITEPFGDSP